MTDCGAMGIAFIDKNFVCHHHLEERTLMERGPLEVIDGRSINSGTTTMIAKLHLEIHAKHEQLACVHYNARLLSNSTKTAMVATSRCHNQGPKETVCN